MIVRFGEPDRRDQRLSSRASISASTGAGLIARWPVHRADRLDRQAHPQRQDGPPAGALDRPAPAPGRRLRPLPDRRSAADVHLGQDRGAGQRPAQADPRLGDPQRARQAAVRRPAQPGARPADGEYQARARPGRPPIWRRDRRRPDQARRPSRGHSARIRPSSGCAPPASRRRGAIRAQGYKQAQIIRAEADAEAAKHLCRSLWQGSGFLRFLPGDADLRDDLRRRRRRTRAARASSCRRTTNICRSSRARTDRTVRSGEAAQFESAVQPRTNPSDCCSIDQASAVRDHARPGRSK